MFTTPLFFKLVSLFMFGVFLLVGGLSISTGMTMQMNGIISPCPFTHDDGALCPMSLATHVAEWKQLSNARPTALSTAAVALMLFVYFLYFADQPKRQRVFFQHLRRTNAVVGVFAGLFSAFSDGTLHSRLFA